MLSTQLLLRHHVDFFTEFSEISSVRNSNAKVRETFIVRSSSNSNAFYFYGTMNVGLGYTTFNNACTATVGGI